MISDTTEKLIEEFKANDTAWADLSRECDRSDAHWRALPDDQKSEGLEVYWAVRHRLYRETRMRQNQIDVILDAISADIGIDLLWGHK